MAGKRKDGNGKKKTKTTCGFQGCTYRNTPLLVSRHYGGAHARKVRLTPIQHGTNAGYTKHLRRGESPCKRCRQAHREMRRAHRMRQRSERSLAK